MKKMKRKETKAFPQFPSWEPNNLFARLAIRLNKLYKDKTLFLEKMKRGSKGDVLDSR